MTWRWVLLALLLAPTLGAADGPVRHRFDTVVIDPGHGGEDRGAVGPGGLLEKELVLDISRRLAAQLRAAGLHVVRTRHADVHVPLETRTSIANDARGDLFVSIHANASSSRQARGIEAYFASLEASDETARQVAARENRALGARTPTSLLAADPLVALLGDLIATEHLQESDEFARLAHAELSAIDGVPTRGVRQAPFVVLMGVQMPASLIEIGFLTHPGEAAQLAHPARREVLAGAISRAVLRFRDRYDARRGAARESADAAGGG